MSERRGTKGLELWCKKMTEGYPGVKIDNMTTSWRDGLAFCAMIHHFRPDLIDFTKLHKDDVYHNNELAFRIAEHHLGIPALLEPEDMVEYSVPDRLCILTYLSQFYQTFAVPQGSAARVAPKRPQTVPDHGIVSPASTSPPTKMALTSAGKIRREPCTKCALPVFIAERLNVGKLLFHRTCFRCARCNSQLTLANSYETENGDYCCEICPDEEKLMSKKTTETLLQRSLSDEEKRANLKMITSDPDEFSTMFETALESVDSDKGSGAEFAQARSQFFQTQMESSESGAEEPPDLPRSSPPRLAESDKTGHEDSIVNSARVDSSFPNRPTTVNISTSISVNKREGSSPLLDRSRNVVTKDISAQEGDVSLVKARMRLFENNRSKESDISKSDVYRKSLSSEKVPRTPEKHPAKTIPIVRLEELENFDDKKDDKIIGEPVVAVSEDETKHSVPESIVLEEDNQEPAQKRDEAPVKQIIEGGSITNEITNVEAINEVLVPLDNKTEDSIITEVVVPLDNKIEDSIITEVGVPLDNRTEDSIITLDSTDDSVILIEDSPVKTEPQQNVADIDEEVSGVASVDASPIASQKSIVEDPIVVSEERTTSPIVTEIKEVKLEDISPSKDPTKEESKLRLRLETTEDSNKSPASVSKDYPSDLDPFGDESEEEKKIEDISNRSLNPFGSDDEEDDPEPLDNQEKKMVPNVAHHVVERSNINPFDDDEPSYKPLKPLVSPRMKKKVIPNAADREITGTPDHLAGVLIERNSVNPFETSPQPVARKKKVIVPTKISLNPFSSDEEESEDVSGKQPVPKPRISRTTVQPPEPKPREAGFLSLNANVNFGSNSSISSGSAYGGSARKKKPAPRPPIPGRFYDSPNSSLTSSPCRSLQYSPNVGVRHKKHKAPAPPVPKFASTPLPGPKEVDSPCTLPSPIKIDMSEDVPEIRNEDGTQQEKSAKDETNRNRRSQDMPMQKSASDENLSNLHLPNKSTFGKWKRRKGQAPSKPIPQKRTITCLPMAEIRRELEFIEIQQQGLEKQGVRLEQIIREKCEGTEADTTTATEDDIPIDVEDLILQLFELVNEKNELFRKQTELMYLRRQQRLEEEHADVEYQIRCLMLQPEANKTDSDKTREEELIKRLVDIVERRNEIVECLEMDRVREAEEDDSINNHINLYTLNRDADKSTSETPQKEKGKEKKKHKKEKKSKHKSKEHVDMDKDVDESELYSTLEKKKKKKFALF